MSLRRRSLVVLSGALGLLAVLFIVTEFLFYFPFTYLSLDINAETTLPKRKGELTVLFTGDIMLDETARSSVRSFGYDYPFTKTRQIIAAADLAIGNLEGPVTTGCKKIPGKSWSYKVDPASVHGLKAAGFDAMVLANNHITDCGDVGISESMVHLRKVGIEPFGGGLTLKQASKPLLVTKKGVRIGVLAYLAPHIYLKGKKFSYFRYAARRGHGGGAYGTRRRLAEEIKRVRAKVDILIVVFHVGDRYLKRLRDEHVALLHYAVDQGASAVVCHGTHIAGPLGVYKGRPILQGVGNFAFGSMNPFATAGLMAIFYVSQKHRRIERTLVVPVYTNNLNPLVNHRPLILKGYMGRRVLEDLKARSSSLGGHLERQGNLLWLSTGGEK